MYVLCSKLPHCFTWVMFTAFLHQVFKYLKPLSKEKPPTATGQQRACKWRDVASNVPAGQNTAYIISSSSEAQYNNCENTISIALSTSGSVFAPRLPAVTLSHPVQRVKPQSLMLTREAPAARDYSSAAWPTVAITTSQGHTAPSTRRNIPPQPREARLMSSWVLWILWDVQNARASLTRALYQRECVFEDDPSESQAIPSDPFLQGFVGKVKAVTTIKGSLAAI